jgi:hypothetical protein
MSQQDGVTSGAVTNGAVGLDARLQTATFALG